MMNNVLIKVSGDLTENQEFFEFAVKKARENYVVVICGSGTKISAALEEAGFEVKFDRLGSRVTKTWEERMVMRGVLERKEKCLQDRFVGRGVTVESPILYAGKVLCPINGDDLVRAYRIGFDEIFVFTTKERVEKKKKAFSDLPNLEVIGV